MPYRMGKRQAFADRTRQRIVAAAREVVASGTPATVSAVARKAGVSRVTVYNSIGAKDRLFSALVPAQPRRLSASTARERLHELLRQTSAGWAANPGLFRHLPQPLDSAEEARQIAERLADEDELRPGCSIKEAEDVIAVLTSFSAFDRLHHDGRRTPTVVAEILMRLAGGVLAYHP